jgi:adenylate kinase
MVEGQQQKIIIFIGPPGAGKGTLARLCTGRLGWQQCSTGDLCRKHIAEKTVLGQQIDELIKSGTLISDSLIIDLVEDWLQHRVSHKTHIILDGVPRTFVQAKLLDALLAKPPFAKFGLAVIEMHIDNETVMSRLMSRLVCANRDCSAVYSCADGNHLDYCYDCAAPVIRRVDDVEKVIRDRITTFHKHARDLITYYEQQGIPVRTLNARQPVEAVYESFMKLIGTAERHDQSA